MKTKRNRIPIWLLCAALLQVLTCGAQPVTKVAATGTNYVLQMTTNLASGNWVTATNGISYISLQCTNAPDPAFYRLHYYYMPSPVRNNFWRIRSVP